MVLRRSAVLFLLMIAAGMVCGCAGGGDRRLAADLDRELESQTREWIEEVTTRSDNGARDVTRLTKEIAPLEEELAAARRELAAVELWRTRGFASARTDAGPQPADRMAAGAWKNALDEKLATIASDGEERKLRAMTKIAGISKQIDKVRRALNTAEQYVRTPEQITAEARRYKAFLIAMDRPGAWQLQQRIDKLDLVNVDLYEILDRLGGYGNIVLNFRALEAAGARFDRPVTYKGRDVKFGKVLEEVFAQASGNHYAITVGSLGNVVLVSTPQAIKNSVMLYERTAAQVAASPYKANRNMMAEKLSRFEFIEIDFSIAFQFVEDVVERKVRIDWDALKRYDITPETLITIHSIRNPTYALLIRLLLDQAGGGKALLDVKVNKGDIIVTPLKPQADRKPSEK